MKPMSPSFGTPSGRITVTLGTEASAVIAPRSSFLARSRSARTITSHRHAPLPFILPTSAFLFYTASPTLRSMSWPLVPLLCTVLITAGVAADKILHDREHKRVRKSLKRLWDRLDKTPVPQIPKFVARRTLAATASIFGRRKWSFRAPALICLLSFGFTVTALALGSWLARADLSVLYEVMSVDPAHFLLTNLLFDSITILVTLSVLQVIKRVHPGLGLILLFVDCLLAYLLAITCLYSIFWVTWPSPLPFSWLDTFSFPAQVRDAPRPNPDLRPIIAFFCFAATTLFPTVVYALLVLATTMAKPLISAVRSAALYVLRPTWDPKKDTIFTILGSLLAFLVAVAGVIHYFLT